MIKKCRVLVIVVYVTVEPTDGVGSDTDEFYLVSGTKRQGPR
jgi:hypothetical protein